MARPGWLLPTGEQDPLYIPAGFRIIETMSSQRKRLGELLMDCGLLTSAQLDQALEWQRQDRRRLGVILIERGLIKATKLTQILSHQFQLPFVNLERVRFTAELVATVPVHLARQRRLVPICTSGHDVLFLATDDPGDESLADEAGRACNKEIRLMVAAPDQVQMVLDTYYPKIPSGRPPPSDSILPAGNAREPMGAVRAAVAHDSSARTEEVVELSDADLVLVSEAPETAGPCILVVDATETFTRQCARAAEAQGLRMELTELASVTNAAGVLRPVALVLMEDVYAMDRIGLTRLSIQTGAHLIIWSHTLGVDYLEPLLAAAKQHPTTTQQ